MYVIRFRWMLEMGIGINMDARIAAQTSGCRIQEVVQQIYS